MLDDKQAGCLGWKNEVLYFHEKYTVTPVNYMLSIEASTSHQSRFMQLSINILKFYLLSRPGGLSPTNRERLDMMSSAASAFWHHRTKRSRLAFRHFYQTFLSLLDCTP